ncbi:uncharacterized protein A4U43_C05F4870 [Asparagus officinalis]|uniref:Uncharacterized protein n=1 Tax=Asparagus officinalis TaxID=4686 RepID=A0A5P1ETM1_ASPOF|nr:uncharacterized protein A4U43_C05F4870 [Asparagus officinalis]
MQALASSTDPSSPPKRQQETYVGVLQVERAKRARPEEVTTDTDMGEGYAIAGLELIMPDQGGNISAQGEELYPNGRRPRSREKSLPEERHRHDFSLPEALGGGRKGCPGIDRTLFQGRGCPGH